MVNMLPTREMPFGMMTAIAGLDLASAVDRCGDFVLFRLADDYYAIVGPWNHDTVDIVSHWFGEVGAMVEEENYGDSVVLHCTPPPDEPLSQVMN